MVDIFIKNMINYFSTGTGQVVFIGLVSLICGTIAGLIIGDINRSSKGEKLVFIIAIAVIIFIGLYSVLVKY